MKRIVLVLIALMVCLGVIESYAAEAAQEPRKPDVFVQLGHLGSITSVAFSPDGKQVVTGSSDKTIKIWDVSTGREIRTISEARSRISSIAISPSGKYVLSADESTTGGNLKLWDMASGKRVRTFNTHFTLPFEIAVAITPDGRYAISGAPDKTLEFWDMATGKEVRSFTGSTAGITSIAVTPDGKYVIAGSRDNSETVSNGESVGVKSHTSAIRMWEISTGRQVMACDTDKGWVQALAVSPDGKFLISTDYEDKARMWALPSGRQAKTFETGGTAAVAITPDGRQVLFGAYMSLQLWDIASGKKVKIFRGPSGRVYSVAISPDGKYALSGGDGKAVKLWNIARKKETQSGFQKLRGWVSTELGRTPTVKKIDKPIKVFGGYVRPVAAVSMDAAGTTMLVGQNARFLNLWDVADGKQITTIQHTLGVSSAVLSPDGTLAAAGGWNSASVVKVWDTRTGKETRTLKGKGDGGYWGRVFSITRDNKRILWSDGLDFVLSDIATGREIQRFKGHSYNGAITNVFLSRDGSHAVSVDELGNLTVWDVATGRPIKEFKKKDNGNEYTTYLGGMSADGKTALIFSINYSKAEIDFRFWDFAKRKVIRTRSLKYDWSSHPPQDRINHLNAVALSRDERFALLGDFNDRELHLWDLVTGKEVQIFKGQNNTLTSMGISPDGKKVYASSMDGTTRLWSISTGREIAKFISFTNGEWIVITPDGFFSASSPKAAKYVNVRVGNRVYGIDQLYDQLYRPDLVELALKGDPDGEVARAAKRVDFSSILAAGAPPMVSFVSPAPGLSSQRDVEVIANITEQGGGIGKVEWRLNGMTVGVTEPGRGITIKGKPGAATAGAIRLKRLLTLSPGENTIEVVAYSKAGIASNPATLKLNLKDAISEKPALYILAVGINKYPDRDRWLDDAVPDAKSVANGLKQSAGSLFTGVHVTEVLDHGATLEGIKTAFGRVANEAKSNDVFILYLAGHGATLNGRYYYFPADFVGHNLDSVRKAAIDQDDLQRWMAEIPAMKSLMLLDTCDSGSFVKAQMATRGLAEKTAIDKLVWATGRAVITASTGSQVAFEGYKGHGVFTYALLQALKQADSKDGNRDGITSTGEMADFIENYVPNLTYKKWGYKQLPQANLNGRSFPIAVVR